MTESIKKLPYESKTDDEIKQLALDIIGNKIFTADHIHPNDLEQMLPIVFMPLAFISSESMQQLKNDKVYMFYEKYTKAMRRSVNGYPIFGSCNFLNQTDYERLRNKLRALRAAMEAVP